MLSQKRMDFLKAWCSLSGTLRIGCLSIYHPDWWRYTWRSGEWFGIFRNKTGVVPGRWGFFVLGLEFGSRNPRNWVGVWLKDIGLWPF